MTDQPAEPSGGNGAGSGEATGEGTQAPLVINAQYVKDLSFETPSAPQIFAQMQRAKPDMQVKVDVQARRLQDNIYEVTLHVRADCKAGDVNAFICELTYGGVFTVNVAEDALSPVLLIECPRLLFPFARQIIAATTLDGGFMPLMLAPVDFVSLYQQQLQRQQQGDSATSIA